MNDLSIIIPAFNEQHTIQKTLMDYYHFFKNIYSIKLIVVMDGCNDSTYDIVSSLAKKHPEINYINHPKKLGKGGGIIKGFKVADADYIAFTDADGSTSPNQLYQLIKRMDGFDGVIGSRWSEDSIILKKQSPLRRVASRGFNTMVRYMFDLNFRDTQCGAKIFRKYVIDDILQELNLTNFAFDVDLLYQTKIKGYHVKEIPIEWNHDNFTELRMAKAVPTMFLSIIGLRMKQTPYWDFIPKSIIRSVFEKVKTA